jgi:hypothetical protein
MWPKETTSATIGWQAASSRKPTVVSQQPAASSHEQFVISQQQEASSRQPRATS